jgi:hypothetical protein
VRAPFKPRTIGLLAALLLSWPAPGAASSGQAIGDDTRPPLRFNGYGTLGVADADLPPGWGFIRDQSQPAQSASPKTWVDSRLGLQLNWQPTPRLEFVVQAVLRKQDHDAPDQQRIDWAFAAWQVDDTSTLRLGRTSPDVFLLANYRNVGFAYPWVRPNLELYGFFATHSLDGVDFSRRWQDGDAAWTARAGLGTNTTRYPSPGQQPTGQRIPGAEIAARDFLTTTLSREEAGLTLKLTYARARAAMTNPEFILPVQQGLESLAAFGIPGVSDEARTLAQAMDLSDIRSRYQAIGMQYETGPWRLMGEAGKISGTARDSNGTRGYVSVGHQWGACLPFIVFGRARPERGAFGVPGHWAPVLEPMVGAQAAAASVQLGAAAAAAANQFRHDQRSTSLGLRWDIGAQAALKLQWDRFSVSAGGSGAWPGASGFEAGRPRVLTATLDFVF